MKHLNQYKNYSFDLKALPLYITEYIVKKKLDKPIDSEDHYDYFPETKKELIKNIVEVFNSGKTNLNCIDTSKITDMSNLFDSGNYNKSLDNIDISKWNVSNVKYMQFMFDGYENFNCDLSKWDVSKVKNMKGIFSWCVKFNCDLSKWDVSNVTDMSFMFDSCKNFNCNLSKWNVSNVENMSCMFNGCEKFKAEGLNKWNVNKVKDKEMMFYGCIALKNKPSWYRE